MSTDDWGKPLGWDPDDAPSDRKPKKKPRGGDSTYGLIQFFTDNLPANSWGDLNSPVNTRAMSAGVKKAKDAGYTPDEIRGMMKAFLVEIQNKPLPNGVAPWRGFLANLDRLAHKVRTSNTATQSYEDLEVDHRI
jgi:hypothetical protein